MSRSVFSKKLFVWVILLWLIFAGVDIWWILQDQQPQGCDQAGHLIRSLGFAKAIRPLSWHSLLQQWREEVGIGGEYTYPPLYYLATGVIVSVVGDPVIAAGMLNSLFSLLLTWSVLKIGRQAFDIATGVAAATLVSLYSMLAQFRHEAFLDFAITGMTAWCAWRLIVTEGFCKRKESIWFGLSLGLALLLKQAVVIFLLVPAFYSLFRRRSYRNPSVYVGILLASIGALLVALPWYGFHWRAILANMMLNQRVAAIEGDPMPWSLIGTIYYPWVMSCVQIGFPLFLLGIIAGGFWVYKRRHEDGKDMSDRFARGIVLAWIFGSLPILTFLLLNKDVRYSLPVLPAVTVMTCSPIRWLKKRAAKGAWISLIAICALPYYTSVMFGWPQTRHEFGFRTGTIYWLVWTNNYFFGAGPKKEDWHIPEMLVTMHSEHPRASPSNPIRLAVVPFLLRFNLNSIRFEGLRRGISIEVSQIGNDKGDSLQRVILGCEYLFTKTGDLGLPFETRSAEGISGFISAHPNRFELLSTFSMPDQSNGMFYRIVKPLKGID